MTALDQVRNLLTSTRNAADDLDHRSLARHLSRLYRLVSDEGAEVDPEGHALYYVDQAQEAVDLIDDESSPEWGEIPDALDAIEDEFTPA